MGFLRSFFGSSQNEIWGQIAEDIGGEYLDRGFWKTNELLLDTFAVSNGKSSTPCTRMRAPFINNDGLYFKVYRESVFSGNGRFFGMQDIQIGDPGFDDPLVVKGNNEAKIRQLLADPNLKKLIAEQSQISFEIRDDEGWFGTAFPSGVDELYFQRVGGHERCRGVEGVVSTVLPDLAPSGPDRPGLRGRSGGGAVAGSDTMRPAIAVDLSIREWNRRGL